MGNSINHTVALNLKNNSGIAVSKGDVVIIDKNLADAFTVTGSQGLSNTTIGVVLDQVGIANGNSGMIVVGGYCPLINLVTGANIGDTVFLSAVSQKGQSHSTILPGDFGQSLGSGFTPDALLWDSPLIPTYSDGWVNPYETWTALTGSFISIANINRTAIYVPGTKIKLIQTTQKYFYVLSSKLNGANTEMLVTAGTDYTLVKGTTITSNYYSNVAQPVGFPPKFQYTCTWSSNGSQPSIGNGSQNTFFSINERLVTIFIQFNFGSTTNKGSGAYSWSIPLLTAAYNTLHGAGRIFNSGVAHFIFESEISPGAAAVGFINNTGNTVSDTIPNSTWVDNGNFIFMTAHAILT